MKCLKCDGFGYLPSENAPPEEAGRYKQHIPPTETEWVVKCPVCKGIGEIDGKDR